MDQELIIAGAITIFLLPILQVCQFAINYKKTVLNYGAVSIYLINFSIMKKIILYTLLLVFPAVAFCQSTPNDLPTIKTDYLKKSKNQKTAAWVLLGGGFALSTTSILIATPKVEEDYVNIFAGVFSGEPAPQNNYTAENILLVSGTVAMLSSIPFFIASKKNKKRAIDMSANIKMENATVIQKQSFIQSSYPAVVLKIKL
jgi:hypothetical protein